MASFTKDTPASTQAFPTLNPAQQALQGQVIGQAGSALEGLGQNGFSFAPIAQQAREQFQTQTIPSLAERFVGSGSGPRSSAFQGALGAAGAGLETNLAALGAEYGLRGQELKQNQLNQLLGYGLQKSQDQINTPSQMAPAKQLGLNVAQQVIPTAAKAAGQSAWNWLTGGAQTGKTVAPGTGGIGQTIGSIVGNEGVGTQVAGLGAKQAIATAAVPFAAKLGVALPIANILLGLGLWARGDQLNDQERAEIEQEIKDHAAFLTKKSSDPMMNVLPAEWPKLSDYNNDVAQWIQGINQFADQRRAQAAGGQ